MELIRKGCLEYKECKNKKNCTDEKCPVTKDLFEEEENPEEVIVLSKSMTKRLKIQKGKNEQY